MVMCFNCLSIKFSVLKMDTTSNAQECDSKNVENDSSSHSSDDNNHDDSNSDFIDKSHMVTNVRIFDIVHVIVYFAKFNTLAPFFSLQPVKSSENNEEEIEENASKTPHVHV